MAKTDVSDPDLSYPDPSVLDPTEDDTTNLNPSKPEIFKPDSPDPDLFNPAPFIAASSPPGFGHGHSIEEPAIAFLREMNASLRELKDFSARFMNVVDLREAEDLRRRTDHNNTRLRSRSISGSIGSRTTDSGSHGKFSDANNYITITEQGRRDRRETTRSRDLYTNPLKEEGTEVSTERTEVITEGALKGYNQLQTEYGDLPHPDLFQRIFGFHLAGLDDPPSLWSISSENRNRNEAFAWLREKDLVFSRDGRCGFSFDTVALARVGDLHNVQRQIEEIEVFARNLRKNGGFFFFREHYPGEQNKIYNGTHVFSCPDRMEEALPMLSVDRMHFCEDYSEAGERHQMVETVDGFRLESVLKERKEAAQFLKTEEQTRGPRITYHYKKHYVDGQICKDFVDPHLTGPWQRLW